jgi:hypothetical protein
MGDIRTPLQTKLFIGMISSDPALFSECEGLCTASYGSIDLESEVMPWETSDYYREELGTPLFRKFVFFSRLVDPGILSHVKVSTNEIEMRFADKGKRRINIDPGYVTEAKVVLASTKDFSHRIYIGEQIYAEVTLRYNNKEKAFLPFDHTFFDFRTEVYTNLFNKARDMLRSQLNR